MAIGWRTVSADTFDPLPGAAGKFYAARGDDIATPVGTVTDEFWIFAGNEGRRRCCYMAIWSPHDVAVLEVTYDPADVLDTITNSAGLQAHLISEGVVAIGFEEDTPPKSQFAQVVNGELP